MIFFWLKHFVFTDFLKLISEDFCKKYITKKGNSFDLKISPHRFLKASFWRSLQKTHDKERKFFWLYHHIFMVQDTSLTCTTLRYISFLITWYLKHQLQINLLSSRFSVLPEWDSIFSIGSTEIRQTVAFSLKG